MRGSFIVLEGIDHVGKTTQVNAIVSYLHTCGKQAEYISFPNRTSPIGQLIDSYLKGKLELDDHAIHLLFSANRWEFMDYIQLQLKKGIHIICDRYIYSGIAYSAAKGLEYEWCKETDRGLLIPDGVIYLTIPSGEINQRDGFGIERYETSLIQDRARQMFHWLQEEERDRKMNLWFTVIAEGNIDQITTKIIPIVDQIIHYTPKKLPCKNNWLET